ncbi:hypothetical protein E2C01_039642 [Portunus trituberculatus]|uniref:Uncharacterized protein n=1 Tax=Portunus trituberculatus TaxID=210409 RepID=A0A5B7FKC2_PORTR|nr:hypothetical protein [Portunus trituberculatus]
MEIYATRKGRKPLLYPPLASVLEELPVPIPRTFPSRPAGAPSCAWLISKIHLNCSCVLP